MVMEFLLAVLVLTCSWLVFQLLNRLLVNYNHKEIKRLDIIQKLGRLPSENRDLATRLLSIYLDYWNQRGANWLKDLPPQFMRETRQAVLQGSLVAIAGAILALFRQRLSVFMLWTLMGLILMHLPLLKKRSQHLHHNRRLQRDLPNLIDGVRVLLGAGFTCAGTLPYWRRFAGPALLPYLQLLEQETELEGLEVALNRFARRVDLASAQVLVSLLLQEMRGGIDIKAAIGQLSSYQRKLRWQYWRGELRKKPVYLAMIGAILFTNLFILIGVPTVQLILRIRQIN